MHNIERISPQNTQLFEIIDGSQTAVHQEKSAAHVIFDDFENLLVFCLNVVQPYSKNAVTGKEKLKGL